MSVSVFAFMVTAAMLVLTGPALVIAQSGSGTASQARTACSLMTPQEIAGLTGARIRDGEPQTVTEGTECRFRSSDGNWVHVALGPTDAKMFAQIRRLLGSQAEIQAGVGDEAYFWGNVRIHVRVGTHELTLGLARNDDGNATTKAQVLALAKLGASRLR